MACAVLPATSNTAYAVAPAISIGTVTSVVHPLNKTALINITNDKKAFCI